MKCVILAGGLGSRLSEETHKIPKPMVEIGPRPILWHIMKIYGHHGINDFVICLGYKGYLIKEYFANYRHHVSDLVVDLKAGTQEITQNGIDPWRITLIDTGEDSMTGGRLGRVIHLLRDEEAFCLTYGDGVGNIDIAAEIDFHRSHGKLATVTAVPPAPRFGQLQLDGDRVEAFAEKPIGDGGLINGGFFVLSPRVERHLDGDATIWEHGPMLGLARDSELMAWRHKGFWQPMDTLRDAQELRAMWDGGEAPWKVWK
ncbi:MAG: glucose-1-phosphate cytidylyltransferase [Silicimonas sp.]|nr:glucose-1-phosphate cytidylyltransferase [Silicimonas sp.]